MQRKLLYTLRFLRFSVPLHSQRSARLIRSGGTSPSGVRPQATDCFRGGFRHFTTDIPAIRTEYATAGERFGAAPVASAPNGGAFAANLFRRADA